ncbi:hypothetical protein [Caulifigura coniformis]|nr:hypothetical protein [Caulifigura coniformis]
MRSYLASCRRLAGLRSHIAGGSLVVLLFAGGCGDDGDGVPVSGTVMFNGEPLSDGNVTFVNDANVPVAMGFIKSGHYALEQSVSHSGIPPGKYRVYIDSWIEEPGQQLPGGGISEGITRLPGKYRSVDKSGFTAEVTESGGVFDFSMEGEPDAPPRRKRK